MGVQKRAPPASPRVRTATPQMTAAATVRARREASLSGVEGAPARMRYWRHSSRLSACRSPEIGRAHV